MKKIIFFIPAICLFVFISSLYAADITSDLVSYWALDGNATDSVGAYDGEPVGDPGWLAGRMGQAVELDGSSQHIHIPGFELVTDTITFAAWINGWKAVDWAGIVGSRNPLATEMIFGDNDTLHYVWNDNTMWDWATGPVIPQNEWAMVALTIGPDKATGYVYTDAEGLVSSANEVPHIEQTVGELNIGWVACCGDTRYFMGVIDEVAIYNRELTEDDILMLATGGLTTAVEPADKLATTWGSIK
ncbi:hypothetical protein GF312_03085 [Candidatus Poribacteria bacterium]|nr:hypothetical protein [Candidatus Poribacteria bacterium]